MANQLNSIPNPTLREQMERAIVTPILGSKEKFGLGVKKAGDKKAKNLKWTDELAEELHKPVVKKFRKQKVYVNEIDEIWAADLVDLQVFSNYNDGVKYLLAIVDIFSKHILRNATRCSGCKKSIALETENWSCCSCCFSEYF